MRFHVTEAGPRGRPAGAGAARVAAAPLGVPGSAGRPAARAAHHRPRPARLRVVGTRAARVGQGRRRRRRAGADGRDRPRPGAARRPRLGWLRRLPDGAAGARAVRRLSGDEHGAPVEYAAHHRCRTSGALLPYQPFMATVGVPLQRARRISRRVIFGVGPQAHRLDPDAVRVYAERFRDPVVARTARDTYRTFLLREMPSGARNPETRRATVPIRALFGKDDIAVHPSLADRRRPPGPTTTRSSRSTPGTSSSTSVRTWCAPS